MRGVGLGDVGGGRCSKRASSREGTGHKFKGVIGRLIILGHFPQKSPITSGSFAENQRKNKVQDTNLIL